MKRFAILLILLIASPLFAQQIPEEFIGEFMGDLGPVDVEAWLEEWHSPYSLPDSEKSHVLFGSASFRDDVASITFTQIARRFCVGAPTLCFAVNPTPILFTTAAIWDDYHHTYIWLNQHPFSPMFSIISVRTDTGLPIGTLAQGTFYLDEGVWSIHPYATYTNYTVIKRQTPLLPYVPYMQMMGDF